MQFTTIQMISIYILPVIFAITIHEAAHGYMAYLLGDKTALILGRLTLNPIKHIDIIGTIIVPLVLLLLGGITLGWAKPIPIDPHNLSNRKGDLMLISIAGPVANFIMTIIWASIAKIAIILLANNFPGALAIGMMGIAGISINLMLMVLNLLPIPQLDGGYIISSLLPRCISVQYDKLVPYGLYIVLILLMLGLISFIVQPIIKFLYNIIIIVFKLSLLV
ncbi:MAG: site-2 protease family protein [Coxiellaceae bacterium]|jgi:Zn-dependent protease|nr:site-2 protease family protein [Coxiellaceae bacterium]